MPGIAGITQYTSVLTTELDGMAAGATATTATLTPPADAGVQPLWLQIAMLVPDSWTPGASSFSVYLRDTVDAGDALFADIAGATLIGTLTFAAGAGTNHASILRDIDAPLDAFRISVVAASGNATLPAANNVLSIRWSRSG